MALTNRGTRLFLLGLVALLLLSGLLFSYFVFGSRRAFASGGGFNTSGNVL